MPIWNEGHKDDSNGFQPCPRSRRSTVYIFGTGGVPLGRVLIFPFWYKGLNIYKKLFLTDTLRHPHLTFHSLMIVARKTLKRKLSNVKRKTFNIIVHDHFTFKILFFYNNMPLLYEEFIPLKRIFSAKVQYNRYPEEPCAKIFVRAERHFFEMNH